VSLRKFWAAISSVRLARFGDAMNKISAGGVFLLCLFLGIVFNQVAIGIFAGLLLGAAAGKATEKKETAQ